MGKEPVRGVLYFRRNGRASIHIDGRSEPVPLAKEASGTALPGGDAGEIRPAFHVSYGPLSAERSPLQGEFCAVLTYAWGGVGEGGLWAAQRAPEKADGPAERRRGGRKEIRGGDAW